MYWYSKYLTYFEQSFDSAPEYVISEIKQGLKRFQPQNPLATVVVIAHNEETRLLSCIWSLSQNRCNYPVEIIGINNNSTDKTAQVFEMLGVQSFFEENKSPGYARACGLNKAKGKYYLSIDADTIYPESYIQTMIDELRKPGIVAVSSIYSFVPDKNNSKIKLKIYELLRNLHLKILSYRSPELSARGAVFAYITELGRKVGYRVDIKTGEDGSLALGLKKFGKIKLTLNRNARVITCTNPLKREGSLWQNFMKKSVKELKHLKRYIIKKEVYADKASNMITPTPNSSSSE